MKTRINKFMSLLLAMVMLISMITVVNVSAATIYGGLTVVKGTATLETAKAYDGINSVLLDATSGSTDLGTHAEINVTDGTKYNVEAYIYPVSAAGTGNMWVQIHGGDSGVQKSYVTYPATGLKSNGSIWKTEAVTEAGKEGWWRLYTSSAVEATGTWNPDFFIAESGFKCYVDKITITPENSTTPVFSTSFEPEIDYDARVDYMPKNFMAIQSGTTQMNISWRNPAAPAVSSVKLYDITDPKAATEIVPSTAFVTTADGLNEQVIDGIAADKAYVYRLDFTFADGTVKSYTTGCKTIASGYATYYAGAWEFAHGVANNKTPAKMNLDDNIYGKAAPSIHIVSNEKTFNNSSKIPTLLLYPAKGNEIKAGTKYKIRVSIKGNNMNYIYTRSVGWTGNQSYVAGGSFGWNAIKTQADWVTYEKEYEANADGASLLAFQLTGSVEDFWIDDVEAYEYDETAGTYKETNIVASIGAADDAAARPADLTSVTATPAAYGAKLSWTAGAGQEYVAVYDKAMSEYTPIAYVPASLGEVTIANLTDDETYNYIVKTVNAEGRESATGVEAQVVAGGEELVVTSYVPAKNFIVTQVSGTQISVSWRNPKATDGAISTITKAEIYDADTNALLYTSANTTANAIVEYLDTDFTAGTPKNYRLDLTYSDGAVKSQVSGCVTTSTGYVYTAGSWKLSSGTTPKHTAKMNIDDKVYKTSAPSIHYVSNQTQAVNTGGNSFLQLTLPNGVEYDTTKVYKIKGYYKKNNAGYIYDRILSSTVSDPWRMYKICGTWGQFKSNDWTAFEDTRTPDSATGLALNLTFVDSVEDLWLDDIEIYELVGDANSAINEEKGNLLAANGAVNDVSVAPAELTGVSAKNKTNEAMIKWGTTDAAYVAVYDNNVSDEIPVAYVPAVMGYVDLKNLDAGKTYNYTVKAVNAEGRESAAGVAVSATPLAEALVVGDFVTAADGNDVTVSVDIKNNSYGNDLTAQLFLAVYDGKILESIEQSKLTNIPQTELGADPVTVSTEINVPQGKTMVMYLWNSLEGMKPLKVREVYTAE